MVHPSRVVGSNVAPGDNTILLQAVLELANVINYCEKGHVPNIKFHLKRNFSSFHSHYLSKLTN